MAHHYPPKARGPVDDTKTIPVCARCHQRCHGIVVAALGERLEPIADDDQVAAVDAVFRRFMTGATEEEIVQVMRDLGRMPLSIADCPF